MMRVRSARERAHAAPCAASQSFSAPLPPLPPARCASMSDAKIRRQPD